MHPDLMMQELLKPRHDISLPSCDTRDYSNERMGINFTTDQPISADELADAFKGVSALYRREVEKITNAKDLQEAEFRLYITRIETKCIDAEMAAYAGNALQLIQMMDYTLIIDGFQRRFKELVRAFAARGGSGTPPVEHASPPSLMEAKDMVKVIKAAGNGSIAIDRRLVEDGHTRTIEERIEFSPEALQDAYDGASAFIAEHDERAAAHHHKVLLYLPQLNFDKHQQAGKNSPDRGVIESIWKRDLPIFWMSEMDSRMVKGQEGNPSKVSYIVDVNVETKQGVPKIYRVMKIHGIVEDSDE
ncbi:hypothetical protein OJ996_05025 [Luteolibacter sp. GHJ8]|uniref:Uncharacterized protein n=1 Tax=Luteolibacter rhizosphaerae TaxID=2989719 RepID=A0ABT3FZB0_9BACT|nr:hypothetical protein [Luteolibacter rhizosphaerae]MCW1912923.1 hypothetical protein [Luteolibacter rhizosphaerae]